MPIVAVRDFLYIVPETVLAAWGLIILLVDLAALRRLPDPRRRSAAGGLSLVGVGLALLLVYLDLPTLFHVAYDYEDPALFFGTISADPLVFQFRIVVIALLGLVIALAMSWSFTSAWGELFALLFWAAVGMIFLIAAEELLTLFLALETMTICLYLAAAFEKDRRRSPEAGLKYFVYGSVSSALFLFGLSLVYGLTGTTRLDAIRILIQGNAAYVGLERNLVGATAVLLLLVGFGFKLAAVPFHQWAPDAYEGAPAPVSAWIASGSKLASVIALLKVFAHALIGWASPDRQILSPGWLGALAVVAALTMTYGNLAALAQRNFKRLLAYSSIAHAGYILVGVVAVGVRPSNQAAAAAVLFYLVVYAFTTVGAFALAAWLARDLGTDDVDDLNGLGFKAPGLAVCIVLLMLSLIGIPPLGGFFGKLYMFLEALRSGEEGRLSLTWLVALALLNSAISAFYYVRVLRAMFLRPPGRRSFGVAPMSISLPIVLATALAVVMGVIPGAFMEILKGGAIPALMVHSRTSFQRSAGAVPVPPPSVLPPVPAGDQPVRPSGLTQ